MKNRVSSRHLAAGTTKAYKENHKRKSRNMEVNSRTVTNLVMLAPPNLALFSKPTSGSVED